MRTIPAATPVETGENKGQIPSYDWPTAIPADQNVTGLPTNKAGKVTVTLSGGALNVREPETFAECRELAGEHFEAAVLDLFRKKIISAQLQRARAAFGKLTVPPTDAVSYAQSVIDGVDIANIFVPASREPKAKKTSVTAQIAQVAANLDTLSESDLRAFIAQMAAKLAK